MRRKSGFMAVRNFLSLLFPGFSQASPPDPQTAGVPGPSRRRLRPFVRSFLGPALGRARRARSPPPSASSRPAHAPNAQRPPPPPRLLGRAGPGARGRNPASPSSPPALLGRLASALFHLFSCIDSELCWRVSCCPLTVGCPSCPTNSHSVIIAK